MNVEDNTIKMLDDIESKDYCDVVPLSAICDHDDQMFEQKIYIGQAVGVSFGRKRGQYAFSFSRGFRIRVERGQVMTQA